MATMFEVAMNGYNLADEMIKKSKGYAAAKEQYGEGRASDPGLFSALQQQDLAANQDRRAERADVRAERADWRAEETQDMAVENHQYNTRTRQDDDNKAGLLNIVQGLMQARDDGQDLGATFDSLADKLPNIGVSPEDIPAMKEELVKNPQILDSYYASLVTPAQQVALAKASGKTSATAASAAKATQAAVDVSRVTNKLRGWYDELDQMGGITNTEKGALSNIGRSISQSRLGNWTNRQIGGQESSLRSSILSMRVSLINSMKAAEELGAKMFDSNKDMEMWLATVTDPGTQDLQTTKRLLDEFEAKYGMAMAGAGAKVVPIKTQNTVGTESYLRSNGSDIDKITSGFKDPDTGAIFLGGNPGDPTNWRMP